MKLISKIRRRIEKLNQAIEDYQHILTRKDIVELQEVSEFVHSKLDNLYEKRDEYTIFIQALQYLEKNLEPNELENVLTIHSNTID